MKPALFRRALLAATVSLSLYAADKKQTETADTDGIVQMKPFKVMAEWMTIRPMLQEGIIQYVTILHVTTGSPADAAGIKAGSILVTLQGIHFRGLTKEGFKRQMDDLKPGDWLELGVADPPSKRNENKNTFRVIRLPLKKAES